MKHILGVDPGGTTGIARLYVPEDEPAEVIEIEECGGGVIGLSHKFWMHALHVDAVVCESFALDGRTPKPDLSPVEIIGWLKARYNEPHGANLVFQTNTQGKTLMTNQVLKRAGYYPKRGHVKGGHGVDALRHALTYVVKSLKHQPTIERLWPHD